MSDHKIILAIESSCDDTSAAVLKNDELLSNIIANQDVHAQYGGVVPELASRAHQKNIVPVVHQALHKANVSVEDVDAVAFTAGPGLLGSLLVGSSFAKSIAISRGIPLIGVNHMQGHILAHFIKDEEQKKAPSFPMLCLTVSGGHTQIVKLTSQSELEVIGETIDDAAGEAFDKAAKIMGLSYPGGPILDRLAKEGDQFAFDFPEPRIEGLNFSFSGLKTSLLYFLQKEMRKNPDFITQNLNDLCASFQRVVVQFLLKKLTKAAQLHGINQIALAGGVSANSYLRSELEKLAGQKGWETFIPKMSYCTDNAAMIGIAGYYKLISSGSDPLNTVPSPRLKF